MDSATMGIGFENILTYNEEFNGYLYKGFYNGSGIGLGDFNNVMGCWMFYLVVIKSITDAI